MKTPKALRGETFRGWFIKCFFYVFKLKNGLFEAEGFQKQITIIILNLAHFLVNNVIFLGNYHNRRVQPEKLSG